MKKIYNIFNFNLNISSAFIILALVNIFVFCIYIGRLGTFFVDVSREVYIPMAMNDGAVLYKDIFNVYAPLGYQINAFITKIFSDNIIVFYILGGINSTIILWGLYLTARIFFKKTHPQIPLYFCLLILFCSIYAISITNYIFPYSYSMIYALSTFIWSLLGLLYYIKKGEKKYLYFSCLLFGCCICFKYEFILFGLVLLYFFLKNTNLKEKLICVISFFIIPILSLINLMIKGVNLHDINIALKYMIMLSKSQSAHNLYSFLGFIPSISSLKSILISFISFIILCIIMLLPIKAAEHFKNKISITIAVITESAILYFINNNVFVPGNAAVFNWTGLFALAIFIYFLIKERKNEEKSAKLFFVLAVSTILISFKSIFYIALNSYGSYYLPLLLLCTIIYLAQYTSKLKPENILYLIIFLTILFCISNYERCKIVHNIGVPFEKGKIWIEDYAAESVWKTYQYIKNETNKEDTILVIPEGAMLNYLTDRKSNNKYYYLLPPNIEIFGEEKIVKDLEKNLPEYIIIPPRSFTDYKETFLCESFGQKICGLIPKYYNPPVIQKGQYEYSIAIYKKRHDKI